MLLSRYADCIAERHPNEARGWAIGMHMPTSRERTAAADPACLSGSVGGMAVPVVLLMYILADSLVRAELKGGPIADLGKVSPLQQPEVDFAAFTPKSGASKKKVAELEAGRKLAESRVFLARFGECVVRANPSQVNQLLQTQPTSEEETASFQALRGNMNNCLVNGQQTKVGKEQLRGTIALNYYRLIQAQRLATGAPR